MRLLHALPRRQRIFVRFAVFAVVCGFFGVLIAGGIHRNSVPTLTVGVTSAAYGLDGPAASVQPTDSPDLPLLLDLWGVGGGPSLPLQTIEPPDGIRAGALLAVDVICVDPMHQPLTSATVELDWLVGEQRFHDVEYTDKGGRVSFARVLGRDAKGQRCIVSVRVHKDDLQSFAYSVFTPE